MYLYDDTKRKKELYSPVVTVPKNAWQRRADEIHNSLASGENQRLQTPQVVKYPNYDVSVKAPIDKPAKEDDFLAGFNYYSDEPEKVTPVSSAPVTKKEAPVVKAEQYSEKQEVPQNRNEKFARIRANADKRTWVNGKVVEEPKEDEFLAGFNEAENEEKKEREALQKRNEAHARARANADKRKWVNGKVVDEPEKEDEDEFLAGFNEVENEEKEELQRRAERFAQIRANADKRKWVNGKVVDEPEEGKSKFDVAQEFADTIIHTGRWSMNPFNGTGYEYRDRNRIHNETNLPVRHMQREGKKTTEPLGSFGIAAKNTSDLAEVNGKDTVNYILGFDTKYIDQDGNLQGSTVPQWVFNREAIKKHNAQTIDDITRKLTSRLPEKQSAAFLETAEKLKAKNADSVDAKAAKFETWLNGADEASNQAKLNKGIAKAADKIPEILDSKVLKTGGRALSAASTAIDIIDVGYTAYQDYKEDETIGYETVKAAVGVAGESAGSAVGAKVGIWLGAAIGGAISGGVLSAPLAAIGGLVGGYFGQRLGGYLGEKLIEENEEYFA